MSRPTVALVFGSTHISAFRLPMVGAVCKLVTPDFITHEAAAPCKSPPYHAGVIEARLIDDLAPVLRDIFTRVLLLKPQDCKVVLSIPCLWPASLTGSITSCLLYVLQVQCLYHFQLSHAAVSAGGRHTGIAVDIDRGILTPVIAAEAYSSRSVLTGLCSAHVSICAGLLLLSAVKAQRQHCAHSTVPPPIQHAVPGALIPQIASATLGHSFPSPSDRCWRPPTSDQHGPAYAPQPTAPKWALPLSTGDAALPTGDGGHAGLVSRWVRDVLEGREASVQADGVHARVPSPVAHILGIPTVSSAPSPVQGKHAKMGTRASLPHGELCIPIAAWSALSNLLLQPYDSLHTVSQTCTAFAGVQGTQAQQQQERAGWSQDVQALYGCCAQAVHTLMYGDRSLLSLQEAVLQILRQASLPDRKALASGIIPYGDTMSWCQAGLGPRLATALAQDVQHGVNAGDTGLTPLLALLPSLRVYHPSSPNLICTAHVTGTAALGMALIGTIVITGGTTMVPKRKGGSSKGKSVEYKGGCVYVPVPSTTPSGSIHRSDTLLEHGLTPAHAALYEQLGMPLPLQDWAQAAAPILSASSPGNERDNPAPTAKSAQEPQQPDAPPAATQQASKASDKPAAASNAAKLEALSSRMRAARKK